MNTGKLARMNRLFSDGSGRLCSVAVDHYQLKARSLAGYTFPDPHDPKRYEKLPAFVAAQADRFRYVIHCWDLARNYFPILLMGWQLNCHPNAGRVNGSGSYLCPNPCGRVQELFPELIELGLDLFNFNPFQPEVMDPYEIKKQFGRELSFLGGMSVQKLLPFGTPQQVREEARRLMEHIGRGGGFVVAPSHDMPGDIPVENMVAFIETVRNGG